MDQQTSSEPSWHGRVDRNALGGEPAPYVGSRFADVWRVVSADPYDALPDKRLRNTQLPRLLHKGLLAAARRTLQTRADLLPPFEKLVHPTGICLRGEWRITEPTPYTGLFATGSAALLIARASDALGEHRPGKLRYLGLAGKLYPTLDPEHAAPLPTGNFLAVENLGGSHTSHFVEATFSTDVLPLYPHPGVTAKAPLLALAGAAFAIADRIRSPLQPAIRQLYPLAELDVEDRRQARAPVVMRLVGSPRNRHVESADLREELCMRHHPHGIRFAIEVADRRSYLVQRGFQPIGEIVFSEAVASYSGDHRLHFAHAPYRHGQGLRGDRSWA